MAALDRRIAASLLGVIAFLIVFGSLYPFSFRATPDRPIDLPGLFTLAGMTRSDVAANVLLYLPFGACVAWLAAARHGRLIALAAATATGCVLSLAIEFAQLFETRRVASFADLAANTAGTFAGAALALAIAQAERRRHASPFAGLLHQPVAAALLASWIGFRLAPFAPVLDAGKWATAFAPLAQGGWFASAAFPSHCLAWLVVLALCRQLAPARPAVVAAGAMAAVLAGRVLFAGMALETAEIAGMASALALWWPLARLSRARLALALACALVAWVAIEGLAPFDFQIAQDRFALLPFGESLTRYRATNLADMFLRCFTNGALVWLLVQGGLSALAAAGLGAGIVFSVEFLQTWIPEQTAEITDPLLALAAGGFIAVFEPEHGTSMPDRAQ
jgi:VanZ family protein